MQLTAFDAVDTLAQVAEQAVRPAAVDHVRGVGVDEAAGAVGELIVVGGPVPGVTAAHGLLEQADQRGVGISGPADDEEAVLVEDLPQQVLPLAGIGAELGFGVAHRPGPVVPVHLDHGDRGMHERGHARYLAGVVDDLRGHSPSGQRVFHQPVEVGGHDHPDAPFGGQVSQVPVRL